MLSRGLEVEVVSKSCIRVKVGQDSRVLVFKDVSLRLMRTITDET